MGLALLKWACHDWVSAVRDRTRAGIREMRRVRVLAALLVVVGATSSYGAPGTYRATIVDPNGGRTQEHYNNSPDYAGATPFNIAAANTATIDAALAP